MVTEITVIIKGDTQTYKRKFLTYNNVEISPDNSELHNAIVECKSDYKGLIDEIIIKTSTIWQ